jgi:hypothetical protein
LNLNGLLNAPQSVVFSPSGTAAALYAGSSVQVVTGLPDSAAIAASLTLQTPFDSLALSDDGAVLLAASSDGVELFNGAADQGALTATTGSALLAFAPSSHDAAVVDRRGAGLVLFRNITAPVAPQPLAATDDAIQSASALAFSADGQQVLLATGQSVATFDLAAGARGSIPCACSPARLARIGDLFRLNELGTDPLWLLDARPATAGVLFVPAMASSDAPSVSRLPTHPGDPIRGGRRIEPLRTSQALPE